MFNAAAPLPPDITVAFAGGGITAPGLTGLKGRDGTYAWHAATGQPNSQQVRPIEVNGVIYTEGGSYQVGTIAAVRAIDGHILWQVPLPSGNGPDDRVFYFATDGATVLVTDPTAGLYALAATSGAVRWHLAEPATWPLAVKDGLAVATLPDPQGGKAHVVAYREDDGLFLWQGSAFPFGLTTAVGVVAINHLAVYTAGQSALTAYAAHTGKQIWQQEMTGNVVGVDDRTITIVLRGGASSAACLDAATGNIIWSAGAPDGSWIPMLQTPTALYVTDSSSKHLIALGTTNGAQLWHAEFAGYQFADAAQEDGVVFATIFAPANLYGPSIPPRLVAIDGLSGTIYWERDQSIDLLVSTPL